jgi:transposase
LENGKDYQNTAKKHEVSYQQVYHWVKKYETGGAEALKDRCGKNEGKQRTLTRRESESGNEKIRKRE